MFNKIVATVILMKKENSNVVTVKEVEEFAVTLNGGSSSLKASLYQKGFGQLFSANCINLGTAASAIKFEINGSKEVANVALQNHSDAIKEIREFMRSRFTGVIPVAIGHRLVHGGDLIKKAMLVDERVKAEIKACFSLAPLHNPANLDGIKAVDGDSEWSKLSQTVTPDTAFHVNMPFWAKQYGVSKQWQEQYGLERYGFHGTSYEYVSRMFKLFNLLPTEENNVVIAHLGNGCSMAKIQGGVGVDTSMGLTPLEGLIGGTRSGDIDFGAIVMIAKQLGKTIEQMEEILNKDSGLLSMYGKGTKEMYEIRMAAEKGDQEALAVMKIVAYRVAKYFSSYLGTMDSPKGIVFTGGIGENDGFFRKLVLDFMPFFQFQILSANSKRGDTVKIATTPFLQHGAWVIPTNEELILAEDALSVAKTGVSPKLYSFEIP